MRSQGQARVVHRAGPGRETFLEPGVRADLGQRRALLRVGDEDLADEVFQFVGNWLPLDNVPTHMLKRKQPYKDD